MALVTHRTTVGVGAIITDDAGRVLLIKRAAEPEAGKWALPGGHLHFQESLQEALTREVKEETGLDVIDPCLFTYTEAIRQDNASHYILFYFWTKTTGTPAITLPEEVAEIAWFHPDELNTMKLAFSHEKLLQLFAETKGQPAPGRCLRTVGKW